MYMVGDLPHNIYFACLTHVSFDVASRLQYQLPASQDLAIKKEAYYFLPR